MRLLISKLKKHPVSVFLLAMAFLALFAVSPLMAKDYRISRVKIDARLNRDGSMDVVESRTYSFDGSFSYAFRVFPTNGPVSFSDFGLMENGRAYSESDSQQPGTFRLARRSGEVEVKWFFSAEDESRTFDLRFRVGMAVRRYEDAAVLYYQFISPDWDKPHQSVRLHLNPPEPLLISQVNEWLHAPLWAASRIESDGSVTAWCDDFPGRTYFEVRALYPTDVFPDVKPESGSIMESIFEEEAEWAAEANRLREEAARKLEEARRRADRRENLKAKGRWLLPLLSLIGLGFSGFLFNKYGKRQAVPSQPRINSEIPESVPPALVGYLVDNREISAGALVSTLLDLARKGFLSLREERTEKKKLFGGMKTVTDYHWDIHRDFWRKNESRIVSYEEDLLEFIFDEIGQGEDSVSFDEIKKEQRKFTKFFSEWKKDVKRAGDEKDWFDKRSYKGLYLTIGIGSALLIMAVPAVIFFGIWALVPAVAGVIAFVIALLIPHRTREGEMLAQKWKSLKRYLKEYHFRESEKSAFLSKINEYFVYGVVFKLGEKLYEEMAVQVPGDQYADRFPWYVFAAGRGGTFSPASFASSFSSMVAVATSTMSTASGVGGGASAGGGGGAGSGGGGAG